MEPKSIEALDAKVDLLLKKIDYLALASRASILANDQVLKFNHGGKLVQLYLPNSFNDGVQKIILNTADFFESRILSRMRKLDLINSESTVFDIGANIGNHTVYFAKILGAKNVYAFEPQEYCAHVLDRNIALNEIDCVQVVNAGLGSASGSAVLGRFNRGNYGATSFAPSKAGDIPMMQLDEFVQANQIDDVSFLKIDVEGNAASVIEGARETIAQFKPYIWAELLPRFNEYEPTVKLLKEMGYEVAETLSRVDFLLHHQDRMVPNYTPTPDA